MPMVLIDAIKICIGLSYMTIEEKEKKKEKLLPNFLVCY